MVRTGIRGVVKTGYISADEIIYVHFVDEMLLVVLFVGAIIQQTASAIVAD